MTQGLLMPKATAVWLVENTSLTFDQIATFCSLHPLEVKGIADGEVATGIKGFDPITSGQLTREEIERATKNPAAVLMLAERKVRVPEMKRSKGPRYTPVSKRQDRPNAILWLVRNHSELKDAAIIRLIGTTKATIAQIKDRTHWNAATLQPMDPVSLGLCTQIDLDIEVGKAAKDKPKVDAGATLLSAEVTTAPQAPAAPVFDAYADREAAQKEKREEQLNVDSVFAKLKQMKRTDEDEDV
jgi:uncharacterized protein